jgi:hypothetical protein
MLISYMVILIKRYFSKIRKINLVISLILNYNKYNYFSFGYELDLLFYAIKTNPSISAPFKDSVHKSTSFHL